MTQYKDHQAVRWEDLDFMEWDWSDSPPPVPPDDDEGDHLPERPEGGNNMLLPCLVCIALCSIGIIATVLIEVFVQK